MITRVAAAAMNLLVSVILGAIAFAFCAVQFPEILDSMQGISGALKEFITHLGIPVQYNVWIKFLIQDEQFVFLFFVILMRILMALLTSWVLSVFGKKS